MLSQTLCPLWVKSGHVQCKSDVCFTPNSDRESEIPQRVMPALPPKADIARVSARLVRQIDCRSMQIEDINLQLHRGRIDSVV